MHSRRTSSGGAAPTKWLPPVSKLTDSEHLATPFRKDRRQ